MDLPASMKKLNFCWVQTLISEPLPGVNCVSTHLLPACAVDLRHACFVACARRGHLVKDARRARGINQGLGIGSKYAHGPIELVGGHEAPLPGTAWI